MARRDPPPLPEHLKHLSPDYKPPGTKECTRCAQELPATEQYFDKDSHSEDGFRKQCKMCRADLRKAKREENKRARIKKLGEMIDQLDRRALEAMKRISAADIKHSRCPHIASFLEELMDAYGGPDGFARHYIGTYLAAAPGSDMRRKMLDRVLVLAKAVTESGAAERPLDRMSNDELLKKKQEIEQRLISHLKLHTELGLDDDGEERVAG